jgi:Uma2 family endonuclease
MATIIQDRDTERRMIARRRRLGHDKFDEVWNGVYVMAPMANIEHQNVVSGLNTLLDIVIRWPKLGHVMPGTNVSDRRVDWKKNFRCPDVAVFLKDTQAVNCDTHWFGGPDFAIEVASPKERIKKKLGFYAKVGTSELLILDRYPWSLSLCRLTDGELRLVGTSSISASEWLTSSVVPLSFRLIDGVERPRIEVLHSDGKQTWIV